MGHLIFDSLEYPWGREDAMVAYYALQAAYPQHAAIDLVYRRCAVDLPRLSTFAPPSTVWKQALEKLAAVRALHRLCAIVCSDPAAEMAHTAMRQLAAAGDATCPMRAVTGHHTLRILHISDLHIRGPRERDRPRRARVLGNPWLDNVAALRRDGRFDLVVFTGDIAFSGKLDEYLELMVYTRSDGIVTRWLDETLAAAGCGRDDLYVVPGNHDVARDVHASAWRTIREEWGRTTGSGDNDAFAQWLIHNQAAPRGMDAELRERLLARSDGYRAWVAHGLGRPDLLPTPRRSHLGYRVTRDFDRLPFPVHIIGLDSAWLAGDNHDARKLLLTDEQILRLCTSDDGEHLAGLRVALVHHPLADLADGESARRLLQEHGVDLLLSGHLHDPDAREIATPHGRLRDLAAGCLYQHDRYRNGVTAMTLDLDDVGRVNRIEFRFRGWSDRGHWHDDDSLYRGSQSGRLVWSVPGAGVDTNQPILAAKLPFRRRLRGSRILIVITGIITIAIIIALLMTLASWRGGAVPDETLTPIPTFLIATSPQRLPGARNLKVVYFHDHGCPLCDEIDHQLPDVRIPRWLESRVDFVRVESGRYSPQVMDSSLACVYPLWVLFDTNKRVVLSSVLAYDSITMALHVMAATLHPRQHDLSVDVNGGKGRVTVDRYGQLVSVVTHLDSESDLKAVFNEGILGQIVYIDKNDRRSRNIMTGTRAGRTLRREYPVGTSSDKYLLTEYTFREEIPSSPEIRAFQGRFEGELKTIPKLKDMQPGLAWVKFQLGQWKVEIAINDDNKTGSCTWMLSIGAEYSVPCDRKLMQLPLDWIASEYQSLFEDSELGRALHGKQAPKNLWHAVPGPSPCTDLLHRRTRSL